jgi:predicted NBD/HSP70 family sugar kinase
LKREVQAKVAENQMKDARVKELEEMLELREENERLTREIAECKQGVLDNKARVDDICRRDAAKFIEAKATIDELRRQLGRPLTDAELRQQLGPAPVPYSGS